MRNEQFLLNPECFILPFFIWLISTFLCKCLIDFNAIKDHQTTPKKVTIRSIISLHKLFKEVITSGVKR